MLREHTHGDRSPRVASRDTYSSRESGNSSVSSPHVNRTSLLFLCWYPCIMSGRHTLVGVWVLKLTLVTESLRSREIWHFGCRRFHIDLNVRKWDRTLCTLGFSLILPGVELAKSSAKSLRFCRDWGLLSSFVCIKLYVDIYRWFVRKKSLFIRSNLLIPKVQLNLAFFLSVFFHSSGDRIVVHGVDVVCVTILLCKSRLLLCWPCLRHLWF